MKKTLLSLLLGAGSLWGGVVPCTTLSPLLFHALPKTGSFSAMAASGKLVALLEPHLPQGVKIFFFQGENPAGEQWLPAPGDTPDFDPDGLRISRDGSVVFLIQFNKSFVYANGTLVGSFGDFTRDAAVVNGRLYRSLNLPPEVFLAMHATLEDIPPAIKEFLKAQGVQEDPEERKKRRWEKLWQEPRPRLLVSELDGSGGETLRHWQAEEMRQAFEQGGFYDYINDTLYLSPTKSGQLWVASTWGQVQLLSPTGKVKSTFAVLQDARTLDEDPQAMAKLSADSPPQPALSRGELQVDWDAQAPGDSEESGQPRSVISKDATRKPETVFTFKGRTRPSRMPVVVRACSRENDLVLVLATLDPPPGSLLWIPANGEPPTCLTLPKEHLGSQPIPSIAVNDEAIWLKGDRLGYFSWPEVQDFLASLRQEKTPKPEAEGGASDG